MNRPHHAAATEAVSAPSAPRSEGEGFEIGLATRADDADIRRLLAESPMPGSVALTYEREPDYFLGCPLLGRPCQVIVVRERASGALAAVACRAIRTVFVNGRPERIGYLGQLRVGARFRGR